MCAFVVLGLFFPYQAKRLAWGTSPKWPILCHVGHKTSASNQPVGEFAWLGSMLCRWWICCFVSVCNCMCMFVCQQIFRLTTWVPCWS